MTDNMTTIEILVAHTLYNKDFIGELDDAKQYIKECVRIYTECDSMEDLAIRVADERGIFVNAPRVLVDNFDFYKYSLQLESEKTYHHVSGTTWMCVVK